MADNDDRFNRGTEHTPRETEHMHRLHDEKMHPLHEEKKKGPNWLWLLVPLILGLLVLPNLFRGDDQRATDTTTREEVATTTDRDNAVTYLGQRWVVSGNAQALPESQMRRVATTANGQALYADTAVGGGGGGGAMGNEATVRSADRLYLRAADGRFVPLTRD
jgi:hypothetical protein